MFVNTFMMLGCTFPFHVLFGTMPSFPVNEKAPQWSHTQSGLVGPFSIPWNWSDQWKRETKFRLFIPHDRVSNDWIGRDTGKLMSTRNYANKSYNSSSSNAVGLGICWEGDRVALSRCNHKQIFRVHCVVHIKLFCMPAALSTTLPLRMLYSSRRCFHSLALAMVLETKQDRKCTYIVMLGCIWIFVFWTLLR